MDVGEQKREGDSRQGRQSAPCRPPLTRSTGGQCLTVLPKTKRGHFLDTVQ